MACATAVLIAMVLGFQKLTALRETEFHEKTKSKNKMCSTEKRVFEVSAPSLISCLYQCNVNHYCRSSSYHSLKCYGCNTDAEDNTSVSQTGARTFTRMNVPSFAQGVDVGIMTSEAVDEASGLAASRKHPGNLYTHNDRWGGPKIYVLSKIGTLLATLTLSGVTHEDWEDIAVGPCGVSGSATCVYIGDIGGGGISPMNNIYRFSEPDVIQDQTIGIDSGNTLEFSWGQTNAETLMVDPDANVYVISGGSHGHGRIGKLPQTAWGTNVRVAVSSTSVVDVGYSAYRGPVGGDISSNGNEVLVKTREAIYYWNTEGSRDYARVLHILGTKLPYTAEAKGDSVCWDWSGSDYFTTSEGKKKPLYFYKRQTAGAVVGR